MKKLKRKHYPSAQLHKRSPISIGISPEKNGPLWFEVFLSEKFHSVDDDFYFRDLEFTIRYQAKIIIMED